MIPKVIARRGDHPGLVHVISAMKMCSAYQPWHDKQTHKTFVHPDSGMKAYPVGSGSSTYSRVHYPRP